MGFKEVFWSFSRQEWVFDRNQWQKNEDSLGIGLAQLGDALQVICDRDRVPVGVLRLTPSTARLSRCKHYAITLIQLSQ